MRLRGSLPFSAWQVLPYVACVACFAAPGFAQQAGAPRAFTPADYEHAAKFLAFNTRPLVYHEAHPKWISGDRFWYRDTGPDGAQFLLFDAAHGTQQPAFDHAKLAAALSAAAGANYKAGNLPFMTFDFSADEKSISFAVKAQNWSCDLRAYQCTAEAKKSGAESRAE